jgi:hypothetical protein
MDQPEVHQVGAHKPGESDRLSTACWAACAMRHAQEDVRDESNGDLDADGILRCAEELADL